MAKLILEPENREPENREPEPNIDDRIHSIRQALSRIESLPTKQYYQWDMATIDNLIWQMVWEHDPMTKWKKEQNDRGN